MNFLILVPLIRAGRLLFSSATVEICLKFGQNYGCIYVPAYTISSPDINSGFRCLACHDDIPSPEDLVVHHNGDKHKNNVEKITTLEICWFRCGGCGECFPSGKHSCRLDG